MRSPDRAAVAGNAGADARGRNDRLYERIDLHGRDGEHARRLEFDTPGTSAYAFRFGIISRGRKTKAPGISAFLSHDSEDLA